MTLVPNNDTMVPNAAPGTGGGGGGTPGGTPGQVQFNSAGSFGGFTVSGDGTLNTGTGVLSITGTGGVPFGAWATSAKVIPTGVVVGTTDSQTLTNKTLTAPTLTTPALGTPASGVATNLTGLPLTTGVTGVLPQANGGEALSPMYVNTAGFFYPPQNMQFGNAGGAGVAGSFYCLPIWIGMPITVSGIAFKITTGGAGASAFSVGLYSTLTTSGFTNRPGALLANSNGSTSTGTGVTTLSFTGNAAITAPGWYWLVFQYGDVTQRLTNPSINAATVAPLSSGLIGSSSATTAGATLYGVSTTGVVGTWANFTSGTTFTEVTTPAGSAAMPWMALDIASVP